MLYQPGDATSGLVAVDAKTGKQNLFFKSKDAFLSKLVWLPDGGGLLALSIAIEKLTYNSASES